MRFGAKALVALVVPLIAAGGTTAHPSGQHAPVTPPGDSVVRGVLFFSPTCPHCHRVITEDLPVFFGTYGGPARLVVDSQVPDRSRTFYLLTNGVLEILLVDASQPAGGEMYLASQRRIGGEDGVPRLVIGDSVLIGDVAIPGRFHQLMRRGLAAGGVDWPPLPGLRDVLARLVPPRIAAAPESTTAPPPNSTAARSPQVASAPRDSSVAAEAPPSRTPAQALREAPELRADRDTAGRSESTPPTTPIEAPRPAAQEIRVFQEPPSAWERFRRDPVGNGASVVVLLGMLATVGGTLLVMRRPTTPRALSWTIPILALSGIAVAAYLTYVEKTGATAVCGPVGDCNTVQQSPYAVLFGVLPVGALGLAAYVAIIAAWTLARFRTGPIASVATLALGATTLAGTVFSIYLTFLEPFVIGATCLWCLTSAVVITLLYALSVGPAVHAWRGRKAASR